MAFLELNLNVLLLSVLSYFLSGQHLDEVEEGINWGRFALYLLFIWLLCVYYQAIGQLVGSFLVDQPVLALLLSQLIYALFTLLNGLYYKLHRTRFEMFEWLGHRLGAVYITKGIYYSIFVYQRCTGAGLYSKVAVDYRIEWVTEEGLWGDLVLPVLINVAVVKVATFLVLYFKFNGGWKGRGSVPDDKLEDLKETVEKVNRWVKNGGEAFATISIDSKLVAASAEARLLQGKIVIAWRRLSLFSSSSSIIDSGSSKQQKPKMILRNLSGQLRFGTLNGLLGVSGAVSLTKLQVF